MLVLARSVGSRNYHNWFSAQKKQERVSYPSKYQLLNKKLGSRRPQTLSTNKPRRQRQPLLPAITFLSNSCVLKSSRFSQLQAQNLQAFLFFCPPRFDFRGWILYSRNGVIFEQREHHSNPENKVIVPWNCMFVWACLCMCVHFHQSYQEGR